WPGNVRELENVIHRATVVAKGDAILLDDLPAEITGASECRGGEGKEDRGRGAGGSDVEGAVVAAEVGHSSASDLSALAARLFQWARQHPELKVLPAVERELVVRALEETRGNQVQAAQLLGITRATLRKRMERFGITSALTFR
ncbi:MAG TPA: helix-turn-helix domain-containing protein, partial [Candidatus Paceibacterota bacterium]|nr:helix-turn-helix domain-containing protein [Candidatus Paceibacterota bacterium]